MLQIVRDRVLDPDFPSRSPLIESLPACILPALFLSVAARALALGVDFVALLVLVPTAFAPYLAVLLVVELLLAFFAVAPRLAAVRVLARATLVDDSLDTVRLTVAVRRLWRRLERYVLVAGVVVLLALLLFASAGLGVLAGIGLAFAIFALRGRLELAAGLLAGLLHPNAAIVVSALAPSAVVLVVLAVVFVVETGASPAFVLGVHALGVGVGLVAARLALTSRRPRRSTFPRCAHGLARRFSTARSAWSRCLQSSSLPVQSMRSRTRWRGACRRCSMPASSYTQSCGRPLPLRRRRGRRRIRCQYRLLLRDVLCQQRCGGR